MSEQPWRVWKLVKGKPKYKQITQFIYDAIRLNHLNLGDRLPPQRELAQLLSVDFTTVTRAYSEAGKLGLIENIKGSGSYVKGIRQENNLNVTQKIHFDLNIPPILDSPNLKKAISSSIKKLMVVQSIEELSRYESDFTSQRGADAAYVWLAPLYSEIRKHDILVSVGAQQAIFSILSKFTNQGDVVVTTKLTYPGFILACEQLSLKIIVVEEDGEGPLPDSLSALYKKYNPKVLYLNPTLHNPTTITITAKRREELAKVINQHNLLTIEDDPYAFLAASIHRPIIHYTRGSNVFYISTLSKALTVLLRTAFIVIPFNLADKPILDSFRSILTVEPTLLTGTAAMWITSGLAEEFRTQIRVESRKRQILVHEIFKNYRVSESVDGFHMWITPPDTLNLPLFFANLAKSEISIADISSFSVHAANRYAFRISLGGYKTLSDIAYETEKLEKMLKNSLVVRKNIIV